MLKNYLLFCVSFFCFGLGANAQNLVPNPSFEVYSNCPDYLDEVDRATGWFSVHPSPDYFNSCAPSTATGQALVNVPYTYWGFQHPHTGNAFVGFATFSPNAPLNKEAIGVQLINPLQKGIKYYGTFFISLYDLYGRTTPSACAANKIGLFFSSKLYSSTDTIPIQNQSQLFTDSIVKDTLSWVQIKASFVADSNYKYVYIGNFFKNVNTSYILVRGTGPNCLAYYYVDDVCISTDSNYCDIWTGLNNNKIPSSNIVVSPNPFLDYFILENIKEDIREIEIIDLFGKRFELNAIKSDNYIRIYPENLKAGIYILRIVLSNQILNFKLIHQ